MSTEQITDAQVLAELLPEERQAWLHGITREERIMVMRRLALARIEAREAAAREREACAVLVESVPHLDWLATRIRARGGAA